MSADEQREATERARKHRGYAEELSAWAFTDKARPKPTDIQVASGLAAIVHLLLAIEDRLAYGRESMLDGTFSCHFCGAILLSENRAVHQAWHEASK